VDDGAELELNLDSVPDTKASRELANEITTRGAQLHHLLGQEEELKVRKKGRECVGQKCDVCVCRRCGITWLRGRWTWRALRSRSRELLPPFVRIQSKWCVCVYVYVERVMCDERVLT